LAAIDSNSQNGRITGNRFGIKGYPTLKYFENGEFKFDFVHNRTKEGLLEFMANPTPPPAREPSLEHLNEKGEL